MNIRKILSLILAAFITTGLAAQEVSDSQKKGAFVPKSELRKELKANKLSSEAFSNLTKEEKSNYINERASLKSYIRGERANSRHANAPVIIPVNEMLTVEKSHIKIYKELEADVVVAEEKNAFENVKLSTYKCDKMLDTTIYYVWDAGEWQMDSRRIMAFDNNGYVTSKTYQDYNTTDSSIVYWENDEMYKYSFTTGGLLSGYTYSKWNGKKWVNNSQRVFTFNTANQVLTNIYSNWNSVDEEWVPSYRYSFGYTSGLMTSKLFEMWTSVSDEYIFNYRETYTWGNDDYLDTYSSYRKADDGSYVEYMKITYDPKSFDADENYKDWYFTGDGWSYSLYIGSVETEVWEKTGFNGATKEFLGGSYTATEYQDVDPYFYKETVEYGDLLEMKTTKTWDGTKWVNSANYKDYIYDVDGIRTQYVYQNSESGTFTNYMRYTVVPTKQAYDCNGILLGYWYESDKQERWIGSEWVETKYVLYENMQYGRKFEEKQLTYDALTDKFTSGFWKKYKWNRSEIDFGDAYQKYFQTWNTTTQKWENDYFKNVGNGVLYAGVGDFDNPSVYPWDADYSKKSYVVEKDWNSTTSKWDILRFDTTIYNKDGYPTIWTKTNGTDTTYKETFTYNTNGKISSFKIYGNGSDLSYEEISTYNADKTYKQILEKKNNVNADLTVYGYDYDEKYVDSASFWYSKAMYEWNVGADAWDTISRVIEGDDWWIDQDWTDHAWQYDLWTFDWAKGGDASGEKEWDNAAGYWKYIFYQDDTWDVNCPVNAWYLFARLIKLPSKDGRRLENWWKFERTLNCDIDAVDYRRDYEWDEINQEWFETYRYDQAWEQDEYCSYNTTGAEEFYYNKNEDSWVKITGYESGKEFDSNDNLVVEWYKEWSDTTMTGEKYLYTYDDDNYVVKEIGQKIEALTGVYQNSERADYLYSGVAPIEVMEEVTDVVCIDDATGSINIEVVGGNGELTYAWSNEATTKNATGLEAGVYTLTITDEASCTWESPRMEVGTVQPFALEMSVSTTPATDFNNIDGEATVTVSGGVPPYTYAWNDRLGTTEATMMYALPGNYMATATDDVGCVISKYVFVSYNGATDVDDIVADKGAVAYPNPSKGQFTLSVKDQYVGGTVTIFKMNGEMVVRSAIEESEKSIDLSSYNKGMYIMQVVKGSETVQQKLIVE